MYRKKNEIFCFFKTMLYLCSLKQKIEAISRSGAVVARWAHNPKVVSSNLASATISKADFRISESAFSNRLTGLFFFEEIFSNPSLKCEGVGDYFFNSAIEDIVVIALTNIVANLL